MWTLHSGDVRTVAATIADESFHCVVTDPPYEIGMRGERWDRSGVAFDAAMWADVLRTVKPGGHLVAFGGCTTAHRVAVAIEDAGWEIRPQIGWVFGSGMPRGLNLGRVCDGWDGWATALKPALEPILVARRPTEGTVAANLAVHGCGGLHVDACRVAFRSPADRAESVEKNQHDRFGSGPRPAGVYSATGDRPDYQPPPVGRWPTNVVISHLPGCTPAGVGRTKAHAGTAGGAMRPGYESRVYGGYGQGDASRVGERTGFGGADGCEPVEVWECVDGCPVAGVDASERTAGGDHGPARYFPAFHDPGDPFADVAVRYAKKAGRGERPTIDGRSHLTVKPLSLMRWLCRLVCPPGGVVFDPFAGSGTTLEAAHLEGFDAVGVELVEFHRELIVERMRRYSNQLF